MRELPVLQCSLDANDMAARAVAWKAVLRSSSVEPHRSARTATFVVEPSAERELRELIRLEGECCPFFTFATTTTDDGVRVEISVPDGGEPALERLTALLS